MIHHLSYPVGQSANDFIDPESCTIQYTIVMTFSDCYNNLVKVICSKLKLNVHFDYFRYTETSLRNLVSNLKDSTVLNNVCLLDV